MPRIVGLMWIRGYTLKYGVHKRILGRDFAERSVFLTQNCLANLPKCFNVNQQFRLLLSNFNQFSVRFLSACHWIEIYYWNRLLWKIYNWKFQLSFPFLLSGATKNRKISIPKFRWAMRFFGAQRPDFLTQKTSCSAIFCPIFACVHQALCRFLHSPSSILTLLP